MDGYKFWPMLVSRIFKDSSFLMTTSLFFFLFLVEFMRFFFFLGCEASSTCWVGIGFEFLFLPYMDGFFQQGKQITRVRGRHIVKCT